MNIIGKIDRKALPAPSAVSLTLRTDYAPPRNPIEHNIADVNFGDASFCDANKKLPSNPILFCSLLAFISQIIALPQHIFYKTLSVVHLPLVYNP